jgi:hypothetical protein
LASFRFPQRPRVSSEPDDGANTIVPEKYEPIARGSGVLDDPRLRQAHDIATQADEGESLIRFACEPGSNLLEDVHQFVEAYLKLRFRPSVAQRVSLAAYELFSNALDYGSVSSEVVFEVLERADRVEVRVTNDAIRARLEMLTDRVNRLRDDPEATFVEEMRRYVGGGVSRAMLGLARVRHEAQMDLDLTVEDSRVVVVASCPR